MTMDELARLDLVNKIRVHSGAITETYRGIKVRQDAGAHSVANHQKQLSRLIAERKRLCSLADHQDSLYEGFRCECEVAS